ncbi:MAG: triphosphoribosyl-dephospho-CoA synthase [Chitinophagaceae bacterium]
MIYGKVAMVEKTAQKIALFAVEALLEELHLTPKPGLVDRLDNGSHGDINLETMEASAYTLHECFYEIAVAAACKQPSQQLREQMAAIGRYGEQKMFKVAGNCNTHKGAIWALGLLTGAASLLLTQPRSVVVKRGDFLTTAGRIAAYEDRHVEWKSTHGSKVRQRYKVRTAREEAMECFPVLQYTALPAWDRYDQEPENIRRLNVLIALMSVVDDTCILHRTDMEVLREVQEQSYNIIRSGGLGVYENWQLFAALDIYVTDQWVSPGGSADLLAATIFLQKIIQHYNIK